MNEFSAAEFVGWSAQIKAMREAMAQRVDMGESACHVVPLLKRGCEIIHDNLMAIECKLSANIAKRLARDIREDWSDEAIKISTDNLHACIRDEMAGHLFFWVPGGRSAFFGKTGDEMLGEQCVDRFAKSGVASEVERAARCFAFGEHTACVFHLMRIVEAGVMALGKAIGYQWEDNPNWGRMFQIFDHQLAAGPGKRTGAWKDHGEFLEEIGAHLRAVKKWRNSTMHLDKSYDEAAARNMLTVIPAFMKQLASQVDEDGQFV